jgi:hypothetical protein
MDGSESQCSDTMITSIIFATIGIALFPPSVVNIEKTYHSAQQESVACNCVAFVRQYRPDAPNINASDYTISTTTPYAGAIAVMRYPSGASHVAIVVSVTETHVELLHANVVPCEVTNDYMHVDNPRLLGYL